MTESIVVYSTLKNADAGADLARQIRHGLHDRAPDALILFASPVHDFPALLGAITDGCRPGAMVGCSSAGEFVSGAAGTGLACAVALLSSEMRFGAADRKSVV